ncbi:hypothetical protein IHQ71_18690 [Rhizobium sp. TH2]|uniref:DUF7336 domain-containing protein n=1 Tax=Rhizobium sp. TH2 TaxID=2775403 RepID=UPI0021585100|nr:hypothetical protein [Rhizobium sp. TH2]UVC07235.1 hypothetical protein IHQ71_18690 [Rhizobium sp. TH2]
MKDAIKCSQEILAEFSIGGFFYEARKRNFVISSGKRAVMTLAALNDIDFATYNPQQKLYITSVIWRLPDLLRSYQSRCIEFGADSDLYAEFAADVNKLVHSIMERLLDNRHQQNPEKVHLLFHTHVFDDDNEDEKLIGVFSSKLNADTARLKASELPGFRDHLAGFHIEEYDIDRMEWSEGFATV